jgi:hypothetical protein
MMSNKSYKTIINDCEASMKERLNAARYLALENDRSQATCEIDLHCHSFYSDGYNSPAGKVYEAFLRKMRALTICDHDVIDGQLEAIEAGTIFNVEVIPGVEFYTDRPGIEIQGFFPDTEHFLELLAQQAFDPVCEPIRQAKQKQLFRMLDRVPECFMKLGMNAEITTEDVDLYVRNGVSTKGDISVIMWQKYGKELAAANLATDVKDFHARYTSRDDMLNIPLKADIDLSPIAFIKRIRDWGGLPGLAHPTELRRKENLNNAALYELICELAYNGLQCIEVDGWRNGICPECGKSQTDVFEELRQRYNQAHPAHVPLLFTNGSDDHNQPGEGLELGCGRNNNLHPEFGRYSNVRALRERQKTLNFPSELILEV